jgi:hypothetical protein
MNESEYFEAEAAYVIQQMQTPNAPENYADQRMVEITKRAMASKLEAARDKGRHGWWNSEQCSIEDLKKMLLEHIEKGDMIDVMNFAGMIFIREKCEPAKQEIKYPAKFMCQWPSGSTACCKKHSEFLTDLARHLSFSAPLEDLAEPTECESCVNLALKSQPTRISTLPSDPGYSTIWFGSKVFLNGKELEQTITADSERGEVLVNLLKDGMPYLLPCGTNIAREWLYGEVRIELGDNAKAVLGIK